MCPKCYDEMIYGNFFAQRIIDGVNVYSCGIYEKTLQKLIRGLKYHKQKELAYYLAKFMYEYCTYKDVNGIKTLYVSFKNCSTFASKLMTPQEAFDFLILDGHPFGKEKVE